MLSTPKHRLSNALHWTIDFVTSAARSTETNLLSWLYVYTNRTQHCIYQCWSLLFLLLLCRKHRFFNFWSYCAAETRPVCKAQRVKHVVCIFILLWGRLHLCELYSDRLRFRKYQWNSTRRPNGIHYIRIYKESEIRKKKWALNSTLQPVT